MLLFNNLLIPVIIISIFLYGFYKKKNIYELFLDGTIEGFKLIINIAPTIITMIFVINIFIRSGFINLIFNKSGLVSNHLISMMILRPISGNASLGIMQEIFNVYTPDSFNGFMASILQGSTETTIYVVALYYGSIGIKKARDTLKIGLLVDFIGIILSLVVGYICYFYIM